MADHYYSTRPLSEHDFKEIEVELLGIRLHFDTDAGVFSKKRIDPGTELLIKSLPLSTDLHSIFDLGCGYGPIGLTIAKLLPGATVYMSDINERAVELAKKNAAKNGINNVEIKAGEGFLPFINQSFDLIATNPPIRAGKKNIYALVEDAWKALRPGGRLILVILTRQGAKSMEQKMAAVFGNITEIKKGGGYRAISSQK